jgi:hypothetical protein
MKRDFDAAVFDDFDTDRFRDRARFGVLDALLHPKDARFLFHCDDIASDAWHVFTLTKAIDDINCAFDVEQRSHAAHAQNLAARVLRIHRNDRESRTLHRSRNIVTRAIGFRGQTNDRDGLSGSKRYINRQSETHATYRGHTVTTERQLEVLTWSRGVAPSGVVQVLTELPRTVGDED